MYIHIHKGIIRVYYVVGNLLLTCCILRSAAAVKNDAPVAAPAPSAVAPTPAPSAVAAAPAPSVVVPVAAPLLVGNKMNKLCS